MKYYEAFTTKSWVLCIWQKFFTHDLWAQASVPVHSMALQTAGRDACGYEVRGWLSARPPFKTKWFIGASGLPAVLALIVCAWSFCFGEDLKPRDVILITIDTLRADHLGCNGSSMVSTPNLDSLCRGGVDFVRARSPVPLTLPSHVSILTGLYPPSHGVRDNGRSRLSETHTTLAEMLQRSGYSTAAFVGSFVLDHRFGLAQGFDVYDDRAWSDLSTMETSEAERNAEAVLEAASTWLDQMNREKPFFLWLHFYDPHAPYIPPEPYRSQYRNDPYSGEIAYTDMVIGKLLKRLDDYIMKDSVLIGIVGDHGEGLGDHEELTHSVLIYNTTLHVPMIIYGPGLVPSQTKVTALTRTIDLSATLLDLLGIADRMGEGISLKPLMEGQPLKEPLVAYSESLYPRLNLGWSELRGIETESYRWIQAPRPELYDIRKDPGESTNLASDSPELADALQRRLKQLMSGMNENANSPVDADMDPETREKLQSLGYISSTSTPADSNIDPKDKMEVWNKIQAALHEYGMKQYKNAAIMLEGVLKQGLKMPFVYESLASCYLRLQDPVQAEKYYRQAIQAGMETSSTYTNLGVVLLQKSEYSEAETVLRRAIELDEFNVSAYYYLGNLYRAGQKWMEAVEQYRMALQINPDYIFAMNSLALSYVALKRNEEALQMFQQITQKDPMEPRGLYNMAALLERMGRRNDAVEAYKKFEKLSEGKGFERERERARQALKKLQNSE